MDALVLSSLTVHTGNYVTTNRICKALCAAPESGGVSRNLLRSVTAADVHTVPTPESLAELLVEGNIKVVFGVHAYRSGRLLLDCGVPFVIILGGTDVNIDLKSSPSKRKVIMQAISQAKAIVAFNYEMASTLLAAMATPTEPRNKSTFGQRVRRKVFVIPQAVVVHPLALSLSNQGAAADEKELEEEGEGSTIISGTTRSSMSTVFRGDDNPHRQHPRELDVDDAASRNSTVATTTSAAETDDATSGAAVFGGDTGGSSDSSGNTTVGASTGAKVARDGGNLRGNDGKGSYSKKSDDNGDDKGDDELSSLAALRARLRVRPGDVLLLLPAGLRPVKDVLFAARAVAALAASPAKTATPGEGRVGCSDQLGSQRRRVCLRIVGPELDAEYARQVKADIECINTHGLTNSNNGTLLLPLPPPPPPHSPLRPEPSPAA